MFFNDEFVSLEVMIKNSLVIKNNGGMFKIICVLYGHVAFKNLS